MTVALSGLGALREPLAGPLHSLSSMLLYVMPFFKKTTYIERGLVLLLIS